MFILLQPENHSSMKCFLHTLEPPCIVPDLHDHWHTCEYHQHSAPTRGLVVDDTEHHYTYSHTHTHDNIYNSLHVHTHLPIAPTSMHYHVKEREETLTIFHRQLLDKQYKADKVEARRLREENKLKKKEEIILNENNTNINNTNINITELNKNNETETDTTDTTDSEFEDEERHIPKNKTLHLLNTLLNKDTLRPLGLCNFTTQEYICRQWVGGIYHEGACCPSLCGVCGGDGCTHTHTHTLRTYGML
eukprot:GHVR01015641.1.p1 GENE.GHVR01015641.1~~GHVR01015641.1.p1  ORF type:complete len:248 (+),score=89.26 GHVR01015641.1:3-746(+)